MTPHEHYKNAEYLLSESQNYNEEFGKILLARAQVHATLASVVSWPTEER